MSDDPGAETIAELFARDPFSYTTKDLDRIIEHFRASRKQFNMTGRVDKPIAKPKVDLEELGL